MSRVAILAAVALALTVATAAHAEQPDFTSPSFRQDVMRKSWFRFGQAIEQLGEEHARASGLINQLLHDLRVENEQLRQRCGEPCAPVGKAGR